jgi:sensor histidine kinase YesM
VINTKELQLVKSPGSSNGIGISNLKRRLELLYAQKYQLITNMEQDFYEANLIIDLS